MNLTFPRLYENSCSLYFCLSAAVNFPIFVCCSDEDVVALNGLRARCNMFFTRFVSDLVVTLDNPPSDEVIRWLLDCVTCLRGTRQFSVYNVSDVVDSNPVTRSFLLKLLLKLDEQQAVRSYLDNFVQIAVKEFSTFNFQNILLILDCMKVRL